MRFPEKRGQFYLFATVIIVTLLSSLVILSNSYQKTINGDFSYIGEELRVESEKIIDYGFRNNQDLNSLIGDFTEEYVMHSEADEMYFIFGDREEITLAGYRKLTSGIIYIDIGRGDEEFSLDVGEYETLNINNPENEISLIIDDVTYNFRLEVGQNFHFVVLKEVDGDKYVYSS